jgi:[ribosomal protein S18]-alanine N-acetyltransferase
LNPFHYLNMKRNKIKRIKLRKLTPKDWERILEIEKSSFPVDGYSKRRIFRLCKLNAGNFILAVSGGKPVGYLLACPKKGSMDINSIAVDAAYRNLGIGKKLMIFAIEKSRAMKLNKVFLEVRINNEAAVNFYKKLGFTAVKVIKKYYKDGNSAQKMVLNLK